MNEIKYRNLFVIHLQVSAIDFDSEFERIIKENGYSEDLKKEFYFAAFDSIIGVNKKALVRRDEFYKDNIISLYNLFINALKEDGIDYTSIEKKLKNFEQNEFPLIPLYEKGINEYKPSEEEYKPTFKEYNPHTKYGRKKALEQARRNYVNGTDEYRNSSNNIKLVLWLIVIVIAVIFYFIKNQVIIALKESIKQLF